MKLYKPILPFVSLILIITIVASTPGQEPIKVTGSVTDPNSAPIPGARITLYSLDRILQTTSDSSGHFQFNAVPSGKYEFEVLSPGFQRTARQLYITDQMRRAIQEKRMEVAVVMQVGFVGSPTVIVAPTEVAPTGACGPSDAVTYEPRKARETDALHGIVINRYPKMPVARATLKLFDVTGAEISQQQTNERGEFQFKQTPPGRYRIAFQHPGYDTTKSYEFWVARENSTHVTMQAVQLGKVVVCQ
jgi:carboxypeptidase family protein